MNEKTILIWFRNDLRIRDNEILIEAVKRARKVVPVYCFDPRYFSETKFGTQKTGVLRTRFLIESVRNLRESLCNLGGGLIVKIGKPEEILPEICTLYNVTEVYHHREVGAEETSISAKVEAALWKQQINLKHFIGHTLYHKEDLPFPIRNIPDNFSVFRKKAEKDSSVRTSFESPEHIEIPGGVFQESLPGLTDLGFPAANEQEEERPAFVGGEDEGLRRLMEFIHEGSNIRNKNYRFVSSRLSAWLSLGCISSREVYWLVDEYRKLLPDLSSKVISELQLRDYFRFMLKKHGHIIHHHEDGIKELSKKERSAFEKWKNGNSGNRVVDACIKELNSTGYISELSRQYAANFLVNKLRVNWRAGAAYFEEKLIDFSPAGNTGTWAAVLEGKIISPNKNISPKFDEVEQEEEIRKWLIDQNNTSAA